MTAQPMVGNLAWAPLPAFEEVEALDRFNGVPTLGVFGRPGARVLFWRALGYVQELSIWLYVPLSDADEQRLAFADSSDLLTGLVFESDAARTVTVGVAQDNRLVWEYSWILPAGLSSGELVSQLVGFLLESLGRSLKQAMAPRRRKAVKKATRAVRELAAS